jgi:hypothetical protein
MNRMAEWCVATPEGASLTRLFAVRRWVYLLLLLNFGPQRSVAQTGTRA